jgi:hypothetical protein
MFESAALTFCCAWLIEHGLAEEQAVPLPEGEA